MKVLAKNIGQLFVVLTTICLSLLLVGCSSVNQEKTDDRFIKAVETGLQNRWSINWEDEASLDKALKEEKAAVAEFKDATFENEELGKAAMDYLEALDDSHASDAFSDTRSYKFLDAYNKRVKALYQINQITPIEVDSKYEENLYDVLSDGEEIIAADGRVDELIITGVKKKSSGSEYYEAVVTLKNTTDKPIKFLGFDVNELDGSGNTLDAYMSYNKNATTGTIDPGSTFSIPLTMAESDGIAGIKSTKYVYGDSLENPITGSFSEPFIYMF